MSTLTSLAKKKMVDYSHLPLENLPVKFSVGFHHQGNAFS